MHNEEPTEVLMCPWWRPPQNPAKTFQVSAVFCLFFLSQSEVVFCMNRVFFSSPNVKQHVWTTQRKNWEIVTKRCQTITQTRLRQQVSTRHRCRFYSDLEWGNTKSVCTPAFICPSSSSLCVSWLPSAKNLGNVGLQCPDKVALFPEWPAWKTQTERVMFTKDAAVWTWKGTRSDSINWKHHLFGNKLEWKDEYFWLFD